MLECQDSSKAIVLNPLDKQNFDIIDLQLEEPIENAMIAANNVSNHGDIRTYTKFEAPLKARLVCSKYSEVQPYVAAYIPVRREIESWDNKSNKFIWTSANGMQHPSIVLSEPSGKTKSIARMDEKDSCIIRSDTPCLPMLNYSDRTFHMHEGMEVAKIFVIHPGKLLRKRDLNNLESFKNDNVKHLISKKAAGGITFPKKHKIEFDDRYEKTLPGIMGESVVTTTDNLINWERVPHIKIEHKDVNGVTHEIRMECHLTGKLKDKFTRHCQLHSKVFFKNPNFVPYLVQNEDTGKPIKANLGIRTDAVLKYHKPIPLSPAHAKACREHIDTKLKNGTLVKLPPQSWASQVLVVPKNKPNEDGSISYRFVQSLIDLNKNCLFNQFSLERPIELLRKLPSNAQ